MNDDKWTSVEQHSRVAADNAKAIEQLKALDLDLFEDKAGTLVITTKKANLTADKLVPLAQRLNTTGRQALVNAIAEMFPDVVDRAVAKLTQDIEEHRVSINEALK